MKIKWFLILLSAALLIVFITAQSPACPACAAARQVTVSQVSTTVAMPVTAVVTRTKVRSWWWPFGPKPKPVPVVPVPLPDPVPVVPAPIIVQPTPAPCAPAAPVTTQTKVRSYPILNFLGRTATLPVRTLKNVHQNRPRLTSGC
jgi:hypothetical protein